jgi:hypothetical protein
MMFIESCLIWYWYRVDTLSLKDLCRGGKFNY